MITSSQKNQQGIIAIITILLIGFLLSIALTLSAIFIPKLRTSAETKRSVTAFYAADSGIEWCLYFIRKDEKMASPVMKNGSDFKVTPENCQSSPITSVGTFQGVSRALEVSY